MKISLSTKTLIAGLFVVLGLSSCMKNDDDYTPVYISGVSLVHASPTTEKLDVFISNTRASVDNFTFGTKMDYLNAYSGDRQFTVTKRGEVEKLTSKALKLEPQLGYTVFVVDELERIELLSLQDDLAKPEAGKAKIRFVNLSPDGGALTLAVNGATTDLAASKAFKEFSVFENITPGETVTFNVKNSTSGSIDATVVDVKIEAGKVYTLYAKGLKASTVEETKFAAAIFTHK